MACIDEDSNLLFPLAYVAASFHGADPITVRGLVLYERISRLARLAGLRDFDVLPDPGMDDAALALVRKQIVDVIRLFALLEGTLTELGQQKLVKLLWQGGTPSKFAPTLGEMYTMRQIQRGGMAATAAAAQGKDATGGVFFLAQVPHLTVYGRTYDCVVVLRGPGETVANLTSLDPARILMRVETKWYLSAGSTVDTPEVRDQLFRDLQQSIDGGHAFRDLFYGLPADADHQLGDVSAVLVDVFENEVSPLLLDSGVPAADVAALRASLDDHISAGNMVFLVADSSD